MSMGTLPLRMEKVPKTPVATEFRAAMGELRSASHSPFANRTNVSTMRGSAPP